MNETIQQVLDRLRSADEFCDDKFAEFDAAYKALDEAKMMKYDIHEDETGEMTVTPLTAMMKDIENESDFVPDAKTKDERYQQLRSHLLDTNPIYADCLRTTERAEVALLNATRQKEVAEKDYGRAHTKMWALRMEAESLLKKVDVENLHTRDMIVKQEAENIAAQVDVEKWRNANLEKELEIEKLRLERAKLEAETARVHSENVAVSRAIVDTEERVAALEEATRPVVRMAQAL